MVSHTNPTNDQEFCDDLGYGNNQVVDEVIDVKIEIEDDTEYEFPVDTTDGNVGENDLITSSAVGRRNAKRTRLDTGSNIESHVNSLYFDDDLSADSYNQNVVDDATSDINSVGWDTPKPTEQCKDNNDQDMLTTAGEEDNSAAARRQISPTKKATSSQVTTTHKPFKCSECPASFKHSKSLESHRLAHEGKRPFKCSQCPWSFTTKNILIQHERTHTGEKPHTCEECGKSFVRKGDMKRHLGSHFKKVDKRKKTVNIS